MLAPEVAHKYAHALFMAVQHKKILDAADSQILGLRELLVKDRTLLDFLDAPQVSDDKKEELIRTVFAPRVERVILEFMLLLVRKRRTKYLPEIANEFDRLVKVEKGIGKVTVITAVPLAEVEERSLISRLAKKTGLTIELETRVEPAIIGGMITILHNQIIDGSIRHQLQLIEQELSKVKVA
uniref:ATP synthase subunit delta n=1 Tax=uncultured bacterium pAW1 TaxID=1781155 RepID=A0A1C9U4R9_9BACT|nr:hypothetical protein [uncultured bacterium pAW1]